MRMRILYIDTESFSSHANFNRIHIDALQKCGYSVDGAFKEGYCNLLGIKNLDVVCEIPERLYEHGKETQVYGRLLMLFRLWKIRINVRFADYDAVILAYYDETVLPFSFYPRGLYLINHINADGLHHWLKRKMFLYLSKRNTQIMISKRAYNYVRSLGAEKCQLVYHGLPNPYSKEIARPDWMNHQHTLFSPSAMSSDLVLIQQLFESKSFNFLLKTLDIQFVVKTTHKISTNNSNVKVIDYYMSDEEYQGCFVNADAILISYLDDYKYRTSAVMLECIANNKKVVVRKTDGLLEYEDMIGTSPYFSTVEEGVSVIENMVRNASDPIYKSYLYYANYQFLNE